MRFSGFISVILEELNSLSYFLFRRTACKGCFLVRSLQWSELTGNVIFKVKTIRIHGGVLGNQQKTRSSAIVAPDAWDIHWLRVPILLGR
jgi:hypothetical protein